MKYSEGGKLERSLIIFLLRPLSRLSRKRKQPTRLRIYLQDNSAARRLLSCCDGARCPPRALSPRRTSCTVPGVASSTGFPATGPRGSPEPCPTDAPSHWLISLQLPRPTIPLPFFCTRRAATVEKSPQLSLRLLSPRAREGSAAAIPGTPPSAQRPGCPGTPSSQAKWPASRLLPG